jgi:hypothetical protein
MKESFHIELYDMEGMIIHHSTALKKKFMLNIPAQMIEL